MTTYQASILARASNEMTPSKDHYGDRFCAAMAKRGTKPSFPRRKSAKVHYDCDKKPRRQSHEIENVFGLIRYGQRVATRQDRCGQAYRSPGSTPITSCDRWCSINAETCFPEIVII